MEKRSPVGVFVLSLVTLGIYSIYWLVKTKGELNQRGASIPTAWLIIVPFVNIWWMWKYAEGVGIATNEKPSGILSFILLWLLGAIGMAIIQDSFNKVGGAPAPTATDASTPEAPANTTNPESTPKPTAPTPPTAPTVSG